MIFQDCITVSNQSSGFREWSYYWSIWHKDLDGFFYENGCVRFTGLLDTNSISTLEDNPNRWNKIANML